MGRCQNDRFEEASRSNIRQGQITLQFGAFDTRRASILKGYRGHFDRAEPALSGWVVNEGAPHVPVHLIVDIDRRLRLQGIADRTRPDVASAGLGSLQCGFVVPTPPELFDGAEHSLRVMLPGGLDLKLPGTPERVFFGPVHVSSVLLSENDAGAFTRLLKEIHVQSGENPNLVLPQEVSCMLRAAEQGRVLVIGALCCGRFVGYSSAGRRSALNSAATVRLSVLSGYRRKGIGHGLMQALIEAATAAGEESLILNVAERNISARRLYEKLGFFYGGPARVCLPDAEPHLEMRLTLDRKG